jgi:hypothetical protein
MNRTLRLSTEETLPATRAIPRSLETCNILMCGRDRLNLRIISERKPGPKEVALLMENYSARTERAGR